jgi:hypothetical protein
MGSWLTTENLPMSTLTLKTSCSMQLYRSAERRWKRKNASEFCHGEAFDGMEPGIPADYEF